MIHPDVLGRRITGGGKAFVQMADGSVRNARVFYVSVYRPELTAKGWLWKRAGDTGEPMAWWAAHRLSRVERVGFGGIHNSRVCCADFASLACLPQPDDQTDCRPSEMVPEDYYAGGVS